MEVSGDSAQGEQTPSFFILLHITLPPAAQPNALTQLFHPQLDKQPHWLRSVHAVSGCICTSIEMLFGANISLLLNLFQSVSSTLAMMDTMLFVGFCV